MKANPIICVDFDGVIHSYKSGWQGADVIPDAPVPGALDWLRDHLPIPEAVSCMGPPYVGPEPVIYSARSGQPGGVKAMKEWFIYHGMHPAYFTDKILKFPTQKPSAFLTIDDRAVCFTGKFPTTEEMLTFKPWHQLEAERSAGMSVQEIVGSFDKYVERSVGAMAIAEGEEGWENVPIDCPMLAAVAKLRREYDNLRLAMAAHNANFT
jgi:hypothetical protein